MKSISTKETAEAVLRELPSVLGACVREDIFGYPREVHLLVGPGPNVRNLARDVRDLLEERLRVPVDQRVISIAQLTNKVTAAEFRQIIDSGDAASPLPAGPKQFRLLYDSLETTVQGSRVVVRARVKWNGQESVGEAVEIDAGQGRVRAAASATLAAATSACAGKARFELEAASIVRAFDRDYVLIATHAASPLIGRRPLSLAGAQPLEDDAASAAAFAALKSVNRVLELALRSIDEQSAAGA